MYEIQELVKKFKLNTAPICARKMVGGSVHESFLVDLEDGSSVVIQRLNTEIYHDIAPIMHNASAVSRYLNENSEPESKRFIRFISHDNGELLVTDEESGDIWRAYHYIDRSHTPIPNESTSRDSAEMAKALGLFYRQLQNFPIADLQMSIPDYHNTPLVFSNFRKLVETAPPSIVDSAREEVSYALKQEKFAPALLKMDLPARVTHNEARLRNLLLDNETGRAVCLIDYDTVMPGVMAFDFGNAVRSSCRACKADERQMNRIRFDIDRYAEFTRLFMDITRPMLQKNEPASLAGGSIVMALETGIRYLSDYLSGNKLYKVSYPEQNLYRARVQLMLCMQMQYYYKEMENIVKRSL